MAWARKRFARLATGWLAGQRPRSAQVQRGILPTPRRTIHSPTIHSPTILSPTVLSPTVLSPTICCHHPPTFSPPATVVSSPTTALIRACRPTAIFPPPTICAPDCPRTAIPRPAGRPTGRHHHVRRGRPTAAAAGVPHICAP